MTYCLITSKGKKATKIAEDFKEDLVFLNCNIYGSIDQTMDENNAIFIITIQNTMNDYLQDLALKAINKFLYVYLLIQIIIQYRFNEKNVFYILCTNSNEQEEKYRREYKDHDNYFVLPYQDQDDNSYKNEKKTILSKINQKNYSKPHISSIEFFSFLLFCFRQTKISSFIIEKKFKFSF